MSGLIESKWILLSAVYMLQYVVLAKVYEANTALHRYVARKTKGINSLFK